MNKEVNIIYSVPRGEYKVLVNCGTYNHSKYIKDALNGFALQQTNFPFICLVMDDASTDGEQEVIKEWMTQECNMSSAEFIDTTNSEVILVPHKTNSYCTFAFYLLKKNLYRTGQKALYINPWRDKCEYEAICEGDDYWIDSLKLQKQIDFLHNNPEYTMCFANAIEHYEDNRLNNDNLFSKIEDREYTGIEFYDNWIVPTASVVFKNSVLYSTIYKSSVANQNFVHGDIILFLSCAYQGKVRGFSDIMSVYRRHIGGLTFSKNITRSLILHNKDIPAYFGNQYKDVSQKRIVRFAINAFLSSRGKDLTSLKEALATNAIYSFRQIIKIVYYKLKNCR